MTEWLWEGGGSFGSREGMGGGSTGGQKTHRHTGVGLAISKAEGVLAWHRSGVLPFCSACFLSENSPLCLLCRKQGEA